MSLKVRLLLGAAVPLAFTAPALAQVTISTATTSPVATSTIDPNGPADIVITNAGSVALEDQDNLTAVTIDSNNTLANGGVISVLDSNNGVGVRIQSGLTTSYSGVGAILVSEDYTRTDTDDDGDLDGPVAIGTGRTGLLLEAGGAMTGNISLDAISLVTVEGNDSQAVSLRSQVNGSYTQKGSATVIGANSTAIDIREDVTGDVKIGGTTSATGENARAIQVLGNVGGEFLIDGTVTATGFTSTVASNYFDPDFTDPADAPQFDPDDLLNGGPAVTVRGDLAFGMLLNGAAPGVPDPTPTEKDVIQNFNENRSQSTINVFGSSPAVLIGPADGVAGDELRLGLVRETILDTLDDDDDDDVTEVIAVFNYDYGLIARGSISANGVNMGFSATGLRVMGSEDGQHQTIIEGGIQNTGTINARAFEADAVGVSIGSGASTPQLVNAGSISSTVNTETTHTATAVLIDAGANLTSVTNTGAMISTVRGYEGEAVGFRDLSGTVTSFTNNSRISVGFVDDDPRDDITSGTGRAIAIDLSANTSGVTLTQVDTIGNARIFGEVLMGSGNDTFNLQSGEVRGDVNFGAGSDTFNLAGGALFGDATFEGAGANVQFANGRMTGDLVLGNAAGALSFASGSIFDGAITRSGAGAMSMAVDNSTVNNRAAGTLALDSMTLSNNARVGFVINSARIASAVPIYSVGGAATIGANTVFTPIFEQFIGDEVTVRVLEAGSLSLGGPVAAMLNQNSPFLYNVTLEQAALTDALDLSIRVKTASELGLNTRQSGAYAALLDLMGEDDPIATSVAALSTETEFLRGWSDLMPAQDATVVKVLAANSSAAFGAAAHRLDLLSEKPNAPEGAWVEEFGVYHDSSTTSDGLGAYGGGFGVAAGLDLFGGPNTVFGAFAALESVEIDEKSRTSAPLGLAQTSIGAYGGWRVGDFAVNGAASVGFADFVSVRKVGATGLQDTLRANWNGVTVSAGARANYRASLGPVMLKPYASVDYLSVNQEGYTERADLIDSIALIAGESETSLATAGAGLIIGGDFGADRTFRARPELSVGYRSVLSWNESPASMRFAGGSAGQSFQLASGAEPEDAITAGLGLSLTSQFLNLKVGYDTEIAENSTTHYGSITLRLAFW